MQQFKEITNEEIKTLEQLARDIWNEYFITLLSKQQIDYMLNKFLSKEAIQDQISNKNYHYYFIYHNNTVAGFIGIQIETEKLFLSKLYLKKEFRGQKLASKAFDFIESLAKQLNKSSIYLTVNKYNTHTIEVYKHRGFNVILDQISDIGHGYVMDDYVMEKCL